MSRGVPRRRRGRAGRDGRISSAPSRWSTRSSAASRSRPTSSASTSSCASRRRFVRGGGRHGAPALRWRCDEPGKPRRPQTAARPRRPQLAAAPVVRPTAWRSRRGPAVPPRCSAPSATAASDGCSPLPARAARRSSANSSAWRRSSSQARLRDPPRPAGQDRRRARRLQLRSGDGLPGERTAACAPDRDRRVARPAQRRPEPQDRRRARAVAGGGRGDAGTRGLSPRPARGEARGEELRGPRRPAVPARGVRGDDRDGRANKERPLRGDGPGRRLRGDVPDDHDLPHRRGPRPVAAARHASERHGGRAARGDHQRGGAVQKAVNGEVSGDPVDVLYTYSASRGFGVDVLAGCSRGEGWQGRQRDRAAGRR